MEKIIFNMVVFQKQKVFNMVNGSGQQDINWANFQAGCTMLGIDYLKCLIFNISFKILVVKFQKKKVSTYTKEN